MYHGLNGPRTITFVLKIFDFCYCHKEEMLVSATLHYRKRFLDSKMVTCKAKKNFLNR